MGLGVTTGQIYSNMDIQLGLLEGWSTECGRGVAVAATTNVLSFGPERVSQGSMLS